MNTQDLRLLFRVRSLFSLDGGVLQFWGGRATAYDRSPAAGPLKRLESNPRVFHRRLRAGDHPGGLAQLAQLPGQRPPVRAGAITRHQLRLRRLPRFLERHGDNFFRLWHWEAPKCTDAQPAGITKYCQPHPWSGPAPEQRSTASRSSTSNRSTGLFRPAARAPQQGARSGHLRLDHAL